MKTSNNVQESQSNLIFTTVAENVVQELRDRSILDDITMSQDLLTQKDDHRLLSISKNVKRATNNQVTIPQQEKAAAVSEEDSSEVDSQNDDSIPESYSMQVYEDLEDPRNQLILTGIPSLQTEEQNDQQDEKIFDNDSDEEFDQAIKNTR